MNNIVADKMLDDFMHIKNMAENGKEIDIGPIIKTMSSYSKSDLCLFKDCIDFMLIYKENQ